MSTERNSGGRSSAGANPTNPTSPAGLDAPLPFPRLTARSVLLSVLLGSDGAWLPTPLLLSTTALFGIAEGTARTALSRMTTAGELEATGDGYRIRGRALLARQSRQLVGRAGTTAGWTGAWRQAIVGLGERRGAAERAAVRVALSAARFGELREGVWLRPDNLRDGAVEELHRLDGDALLATVRDLDLDPAELAGRLWDLDGWAASAGELIGLMAPLTARLEASEHAALADGFVVNAAVLRHLAADPLLPEDLLADGWPGPELRSRYERFDAAFRRVIQAHFERHRS